MILPGGLPRYPNFTNQYSSTSTDNIPLSDIKVAIDYIKELSNYITMLHTCVSTMSTQIHILEDKILNMEDLQLQEEKHIKSLEALAESLNIDSEIVEEWKDFLLLMRLRGIS